MDRVATRVYWSWFLVEFTNSVYRSISSIDFTGLIYKRVDGSSLRVKIARAWFTGELTDVVHLLRFSFNLSSKFTDQV